MCDLILGVSGGEFPKGWRNLHTVST